MHDSTQENGIPHDEPQLDLLSQVKQDIANNQLELPSLPDVAQKIQSAIDKPFCSVDTISKMISVDQALAGRVVQVANSALFRGMDGVSNLNTSISRLGFVCVRNLVTSFTTGRLFQYKKRGASRDNLVRLWQRSTYVGAISEVLARKCTLLDTSEAMLAGLLHRVGTLPIIQFYSNKQQLTSNFNLFGEAVDNIQGTIGELVLRSWNLSDELVIVPGEFSNTRRQHDHAVDYIDIVTVANLHACRGKDEPLGQLSWYGVPAFQKVGISPHDSLQIIKEAKAELSEMLALLRG